MELQWYDVVDGCPALVAPTYRFEPISKTVVGEPEPSELISTRLLGGSVPSVAQTMAAIFPGSTAKSWWAFDSPLMLIMVVCPSIETNRISPLESSSLTATIHMLTPS